MKFIKILALLFIIPVLCNSQNRFEKLFTKADSAFYESVKKYTVDNAMKADSGTTTKAFYNCIMECEFATSKSITITIHDYLNDYMNGYQMGQQSFYYNKKFDYELLESKLKKIKRELRKIKQH